MAFTFTSDTLPVDHKAAIRQMKQELRAQLGDVQQIFSQISDAIATRVAEINALKAQGIPVWGPRAQTQGGWPRVEGGCFFLNSRDWFLTGAPGSCSGGIRQCQLGRSEHGAELSA